MLTSYKILLLILICIGCNANNSSNISENDCAFPIIKSILYEKAVNGNKIGYSHALMLDNYYEKCYNEYNFITLADKYLDTVKRNLPVYGITFLKPFNFKSTYDSKEIEQIRNNSIIEISFSKESIRNEIPEIKSIDIWTNGFRKSIKTRELDSSSRKLNLRENDS